MLKDAINIFKSFFEYSKNEEYKFTLADNQKLYLEGNNGNNENDNQSINNNYSFHKGKEYNTNSQKIFNSLSVNLDYLKVRYNTLINSDIIIREFNLLARGKEYKSFLIYIDGMINSTMINDFVLKPLMMRNQSNTFDSIDDSIPIAVSGNITVRRRKKFDLADYIFNCLVPQNTISRMVDFNQIVSDVNSGNCILFIDTLDTAFSIEVKGFKSRPVSSPNNEVVVHGSQEAFVETIRTNTSLLRKIVNNENLIIESCEVGAVTRTKVAICYMKNIANDELISEVKFRINNLSIDSLVSSRRTRPINSR